MIHLLSTIQATTVVVVQRCDGGVLATYRPFLDPLPLDRHWPLLLLPMVIAIGVVYKSIKLEDLAQLPRQALYLSAQILVFMILAAVALWLITEMI